MTESDEVATRFWKTIFALTDLMRDMSCGIAVQDNRENWNLTIQQMRLMRVIYVKTSTVSPEGVMLKTIAETLNVTSAAVCGMVENLTRNRCETNRRSVNISLSEYSKKKIHETEAGFTELTKKMCASLGREEIGKLSDTLDKLTNALITTEPTSYQAQLLAHFK